MAHLHSQSIPCLLGLSIPAISLTTRYPFPAITMTPGYLFPAHLHHYWVSILNHLHGLLPATIGCPYPAIYVAAYPSGSPFPAVSMASFTPILGIHSQPFTWPPLHHYWVSIPSHLRGPLLHHYWESIPSHLRGPFCATTGYPFPAVYVAPFAPLLGIHSQLITWSPSHHYWASIPS